MEQNTRINFHIRVPKVLLVRDGQNLGIFYTDQARKMAMDEGLDLVEVSPHAKPPVCAIMDYGKYKYEQQKKKNKGTTVKEKEIQFRYVIGEHDLKTKINQAKKFLEDGNKVKLVVSFQKRENAHKQEGFEIMKKALEMLEISDVFPKFEGNYVIARIDPKK